MLGMKNAAFCDFRLQHILRVNCAEMAGDGPGQPAYQIFSIKRTLFSIERTFVRIQVLIF